MSAITREEIEQATDVLYREGIFYMGSATYGTRLLSEMVKAAPRINPVTAVYAAYHHGIRIGMEMQSQRDKLARAQQGETGPEASAGKV